MRRLQQTPALRGAAPDTTAKGKNMTTKNTKGKAAPKTAAKAKAAPKAAPKEKALKAAPKAAKTASTEGRKGRPSAFAGKHLTAIVETNPRRKDTGGHKSMEIILKNPGILFEDFIKKGGRSGDVAWDIAHEHVIAK
jgi:hypothetical protein